MMMGSPVMEVSQSKRKCKANFADQCIKINPTCECHETFEWNIMTPLSKFDRIASAFQSKYIHI